LQLVYAETASPGDQAGAPGTEVQMTPQSKLVEIPQGDPLLASASEARSLLDLFVEAQDDEALGAVTVLMYCLAERPIVQRALARRRSQ
jgi:hypothetical protein